MYYISQQDLEVRLAAPVLAHLADDNGDGQPDEAVMTEAIAAAQAEIDSRLAARYKVPINLEELPELAATLKTVAVDLAEHRLRLRKPPVPREIMQQLARNNAWLNAIADGRIHLPAAQNIPTSNPRGLNARAIGDPRRLTRRELESY